MTCCRCNRTGHCQNCSCIKRGQSCQSCLTQRMGNCVNEVQTRSSTSAATDVPFSPLMQNSVPEAPPHRLLLPTVMSSASQESLLPPQPPSPVRDISETSVNSNSSSIPRAPVNVAVLPQFTPLADSVFTWGEYD